MKPVGALQKQTLEGRKSAPRKKVSIRADDEGETLWKCIGDATLITGRLWHVENYYQRQDERSKPSI